MVRAKNSHCREESRGGEKITCDRDVDADLHRRMRHAGIRILPEEVDRLEELPENPTCGLQRE